MALDKEGNCDDVTAHMHRAKDSLAILFTACAACPHKTTCHHLQGMKMGLKLLEMVTG